MPPGFSGNLIFAIIARMLYGNHLNQVARELFLVTGKFYSVAQALTKVLRLPASLKCNLLIGWKNDVI